MKKNLIRSIAFHMGEKTTQKDADIALAAVVAALSDALVTNGTVRVAGLGTFKVKSRKARKARNPRTGETVEVPETPALTFKADNRGNKTARASVGIRRLLTKENANGA